MNPTAPLRTALQGLHGFLLAEAARHDDGRHAAESSDILRKWASAVLATSTAVDEVERLRELAATCYAGLGAECNLPEAWLDALLAASNGEPFSTDGLLPFSAVDGTGVFSGISEKSSLKTPVPVDGQMGDERAAFEAWKSSMTTAWDGWDSWQARAALSAPGAGEKKENQA